MGAIQRWALWSLALAASINFLWANPIKESKAREIATQFFAKQTRSSLKNRPGSVNLSLSYAPSVSDAKLLSTSHIESDDRCFFVFNNEENNGFAIVAGDDRLPEILGYSLSGTFEYDRLPEHIKAFIDAYAEMVKYMSQENSEFLWNHPITTPLMANHAAKIDPLLGKIKWDQGEPYNLKCPATTEEEQKQGAYAHMPVGCVATAMSQVMRYYKWPEKGEGTYTYKEQGSTRKHTVDFENTTYDWKNMPEEIFGLASSETKEALSTFCYHVGVSVDMMYGAMGSGAYMPPVADAFRTHFRYNKKVQNLDRRAFTLAEWERLMRDELNAKRPIVYSGAGDGGGHAFVCDGYDEKGRYHFNWGWNGSSDGFFYLPSLVPASLGTGGGTGGGFSLFQGMVIGIEPDRNGTTVRTDDFLSSMVFRAAASNKVVYTSNLLIDVTSSRMYEGALRLELAPFDGGDPVVIGNAKNVSIPMMSYTNWNSFTERLDLSRVPAGKYKLYPAYKKADGGFRPVNHYMFQRSEAVVIIDNSGNVTVQNPSVAINFSIVPNTLVLNLNQYSKSKVSFQIKNHTQDEFFDRFSLVAVNKDIPNLVSKIGEVIPNIEGGETASLEFDIKTLPFGNDDNIVLGLITDEFINDEQGGLSMLPFYLKIADKPQVNVPNEIPAEIICEYGGFLNNKRLIPFSTQYETGTIHGVILKNVGTPGKRFNPFLAQFLLIFENGSYAIAKTEFKQERPLDGGSSIEVDVVFRTKALKNMADGTMATLTPLLTLTTSYPPLQRTPLVSKLPSVVFDKAFFAHNQEIEGDVAYHLYPTVATDQVTLTLPQSAVGQEYFLWDASGKLLDHQTIRATQEVVSVEALAQGVYFFRIGDQVLKMIKE